MIIPIMCDNQCDEYAQFSKFLPDGPYKGMNSRLVHCLQAIQEFGVYLDSIEAEVGVLGGDLFEGIGRLKISVLSSVYDVVSPLNAGRKMVKILGNHGRGDYGLCDHASQVFKGVSQFTVVDDVYVYRPKEDPSVRLCFVAFRESNDELAIAIEKASKMSRKKGDRSVLFLHNGVLGGRVGCEGYALEGFLNPGPDMFSDFELVICAHLHKHQTYKAGGSKIVVCGSPMQLDFGDEGDERGFIILDTDTMKVTHLPLKYPTFKTIEIDAPSDLSKLPDLSNNYVHFIVKTDDVMMKDLNKIPTAGKPLIDHDYKVISGSRLNLPKGTPFAKSFKAYVEHTLTDASPEVRQRRIDKGLDALRKMGVKA